MPQGKGTYGSKVGRPKKKNKGIMGETISGLKAGLKGLRKGDARESAIRRGGQKGRFSKIKGQLMTGKASPHTSRDESPLGKWRKLAKSTKTASERLQVARSKMKIAAERAKAKKKKG